MTFQYLKDNKQKDVLDRYVELYFNTFLKILL
jgi:hypothetical protein